jgi:hypothetical protein
MPGWLAFAISLSVRNAGQVLYHEYASQARPIILIRIALLISSILFLSFNLAPLLYRVGNYWPNIYTKIKNLGHFHTL